MDHKLDFHTRWVKPWFTNNATGTVGQKGAGGKEEMATGDPLLRPLTGAAESRKQQPHITVAKLL